MFSETAHLDTWRERALARTLEPARTRSVDRLERLVDAARDLANETGSAAFTVAQVAARAGVSLKVFYRCFAGKDDLLVALLEEDSRLGASILRDRVDQQGDRDGPGRIQAYVTGVFELLTLPGALGYAGLLVREERRLAESRPEDLQRALAPMIDLLTTEIEAAAASGAASSADPTRDARAVFALLLDGIHEVARGGAQPLEVAAFLWRFCWGGLHGTKGLPRDPEELR
ncbi:MAG TPA: TetR/AcrR family transcriptional regulator [Acidimicrobiia bacterium]|nr:TetR/AcrR family transcriptional regulator [Acidimicrobiia bacterium]